MKDLHITVHGIDAYGRADTFSYVLTAEQQQGSKDLDDWWRECEYAGICGVDLPPTPRWYRPWREWRP
jgi:hypothetical protein